MENWKSFFIGEWVNPHADKMQWQNFITVKREFLPDGSPKPMHINLPMGKDYSVDSTHIYVLLATSLN